MKKTLFSTLYAITLTIHPVSAADNNKTTEELVAAFMKSEQRLQEAKAKTAAINKLGETVDKLAQELGIEDKAK